jgi:hypothetical protein
MEALIIGKTDSPVPAAGLIMIRIFLIFFSMAVIISLHTLVQQLLAL